MEEDQFQALEKATSALKRKKIEDFDDTSETERGDSSDSQTTPTSWEIAYIKLQLRHALEKKQRLVFDQRRDEYVQMLQKRMFVLNEQLNQAKEALAQNERADSLEVRCSRDLQHGFKVHDESVKLQQLKQWWEKVQWEAAKMELRLKADEQAEQRRLWEKQLHWLHSRLNRITTKLKEEKLRSSELQQQVNLLKKIPV